MPRVQRVDRGARNKKSVEEAAMCEWAPFQHRRNPNAAWPFLVSIQEDYALINRATKVSKYRDATQVGEALL